MLNVSIRENGEVKHTLNLFRLIWICIDSVLGSIELALRIKLQHDVSGDYRALLPIRVNGDKHRCQSLKNLRVKFLWANDLTIINIENTTGFQIVDCDFCTRFYYKHTGE